MAGYEGLRKQVVSLRLGGGQMEGDDSFLVDPPGNLHVENARFDDRGAISKRFGHDQLTSTGAPSTDKGEASTIADAGGQLCVLGPRGTYAYDEPADRWREVSVAAPRVSEVLTDALLRTNDNVRCVNIATIGRVLCVVWEAFYSTTDSECWYQFHDAETLAVLAGPVSFGAGFTRAPKVVATSTHFFVFAYDGADIYGAVYAASAEDYTFPAPTLLDTDDFYEPLPFGNECLLMREGGGTTTFELLDTALATVWTQVVGQGFVGRAVCHNGATSSFWALATSGDVAECADDGLSVPTVTAIWTPPSDLAIQRATISRLDLAGNMVAILSGRGYVYNITANSHTEHGCAYAVLDTTPVKLSEGTLPTVVLAGHAHYLADTDTDVYDLLVPMAMQCRDEQSDLASGTGDDPQGLQAPIGYVMRARGTTTALDFAEAGRFGIDRIDKAGDITQGYGSAETPTFDIASFNLSRVVAMPDGLLGWGYTVRIENLSEQPSPTSSTGRRGGDLARCRVTYARAARQCTAQGVRLLGCGHGVSVLDSSRHVEATPMRPPYLKLDGYDDDLPGSVTEHGLSGAESRWRIKIVHRWRDAQGNVYRSAPSPYLEVDDVDLVEVAGGAATQPARLVFSTPYPTALTSDRNLIHDVEVHQTGDLEIAGTDPEAYYFVGTATPRLGSTGNPALVHPNTVSYIAAANSDRDDGTLAGLDARHYVQIRASDAELFPRSYFDEELVPAQLPPLLDIVSTQARLWALSAEDRLSVRATTPLRANEGPVWPAELEYRVPQEGGECVALAALDDKVIVFKERLVYVIFGEPADVTGANDTIQTPRLVSSDVGCVNPLSVVEGPFGVMFESERGIYLLTRGLSFEFVGEAVKDTLAGHRITSGTLVPEHSEVRYTLDTAAAGSFDNAGVALVFNYRVGAWSYWTSLPALHATMWQGRYTRVLAGALVFRERDDWTGANFGLHVVTAWMKLSGLQGFVRIWRAVALLRHWTSYVRIYVRINYDDTNVDEFLWTEAELDSIRATDGNRIQLRIRPSRQKCESIQLAIDEITQVGEGGSVTIGRGIEIVGLDLEVGLRRGAFKQVPTEGRR